MITIIIILTCLAAIVVSWKLATPAMRKRIKLAVTKPSHDRSAIHLAIVAFTILITTLAVNDCGYVESPSRTSLPDDVLTLLDTVVESGVLFQGDAVILNDWLNRHARPQMRNLKTDVVEVGAELPMAVLQKIAFNTGKLDINDRLKLFRILSLHGLLETYLGEYGETVQLTDSFELPTDVYMIILSAADEDELSDRQRHCIRELVESQEYQMRFLAPGVPYRDGTRPIAPTEAPDYEPAAAAPNPMSEKVGQKSDAPLR